MIFDHTYKEKGMWRGWLKSGQALELCWDRHDWEFGAGVLVHSDDCDNGRRMICLKFWRWGAFIPIGVLPGPYSVGDEPQWSAFLSKEFGLWLRWGKWSKRFEWAFRTIMRHWEIETADGWVFKLKSQKWVRKPLPEPLTETHPYTYNLRSGEVQHRQATIYRERITLNRNLLWRIGWPSRVNHSIDVHFSDEVGERSGSWKGGTIGCSYEMAAGESPLDTLRRMERERKF